MKKLWLVPILIVFGMGLWYLWPREWKNPLGKTGVFKPLPLEKYDFDNLKKRQGVESEIKIWGPAEEIERRKSEDVDWTTRVFTFQSEGKTISGTMNLPHPERSSLSPAVVLIRGYAEKAGYYPGSGSWRMAEKLAEAGYVTFSIDFLGYGESDEESAESLEARFEKVVSVMDLLASVEALPYIDKSKIGIWAHSNGGQIALSVLEVTGKNYPTVMWAPMTQPFPASVLETIDEGSPVKEMIEEFERYYDPRRYAFENYYQWIEAPILIQQGTADEWCKVEWQEVLQGRMKELGKEAELVVYPENDHNLSKDWEAAVKKSLEWMRERV